jgi:hypothetical protein
MRGEVVRGKREEEGVDLIIISNFTGHTAYRDLWRHFL